MDLLSAKVKSLKPHDEPTIRHWFNQAITPPREQGVVKMGQELLDLLRAATSIENDPNVHIPLLRYIHGAFMHGDPWRAEAWQHAMRLGVSPNQHVPFDSAIELWACPGGPAFFLAGNAKELAAFTQAGAKLDEKDDFNRTYSNLIQAGGDSRFNLSYSVDLRPVLAQQDLPAEPHQPRPARRRLNGVR
jgi:hypothetical protein